MPSPTASSHLVTRLRICIDPDEYARRRRPYFIRYVDYDFRYKHQRVEAYEYVQDCVLEVSFQTDSAREVLPSQMPLVCFNPDDDGQQADESDAPFRRAYRKRLEKIAWIRDELDRHFPECEQEGAGYLDDNFRMFVVMHLLSDFRVVVASSSSSSTPALFRWYGPVDVETQLDDVELVQFASVDGIVSYADRMYPGQRQAPRCTAEGVSVCLVVADVLV